MPLAHTHTPLLVLGRQKLIGDRYASQPRALPQMQMQRMTDADAGLFLVYSGHPPKKRWGKQKHRRQWKVSGAEESISLHLETHGKGRLPSVPGITM